MTSALTVVLNTHNVRNHPVFAGNRKNGFIIFPSHKKNCMENTQSYRKHCNPQWGPAMRCETQLDLPDVSCWPSVSFPSAWLTIWCGESYIYWVLRNNFSINSVNVTRPCDILVLTASSSSSSSSATLSSVFLPWERASWIILGCHYASFPTRSLGFLELFSNSPLSAFGHLSWAPASCLAITRSIYSQWIQAWSLPLS